MQNILNTVQNLELFELLSLIPDESIHLILTDLPYKVTACKWDREIPLDRMWSEFRRVVTDKGVIALTSQQPFTTDLISTNRDMFKYEMVWVKTRKTDFVNAKNKPMRQHETIQVFSKGKTGNGSKTKMNYYPVMGEGVPYKRSDKNDRRVGYIDRGNRKVFLETKENEGTRYPSTVLNFANPNHGSKHPTQKPVKLFEYIIELFTLEGDIVLDPCVGSGTTAVACAQLKRNLIVGDIEKKYCNITEERLGEFYGR